MEGAVFRQWAVCEEENLIQRPPRLLKNRYFRGRGKERKKKKRKTRKRESGEGK